MGFYIYITEEALGFLKIGGKKMWFCLFETLKKIIGFHGKKSLSFVFGFENTQKKKEIIYNQFFQFKITLVIENSCEQHFKTTNNTFQLQKLVVNDNLFSSEINLNSNLVLANWNQNHWCLFPKASAHPTLVFGYKNKKTRTNCGNYHSNY